MTNLPSDPSPDTPQMSIQKIHIGAVVEFAGPTTGVLRGTVMAIVDGVPYAAVAGYADTFPLTPISPEQVAFLNRSARQNDEPV